MSRRGQAVSDFSEAIARGGARQERVEDSVGF